MRLRPTVIALAAIFFTLQPRAFASDAGDGGGVADAGASPSSDGGGGDAASANEASGSGDAGPTPESLACDGALCDTTNGAECGVSGGRLGARRVSSTPASITLFVIACWAAACARRGTYRPGRQVAIVAGRPGDR